MEFDTCGADAGIAITISHLERRWCINPNERQTGALADFLIGPAARGACRAGSCDGRRSRRFGLRSSAPRASERAAWDRAGSGSETGRFRPALVSLADYLLPTPLPLLLHPLHVLVTRTAPRDHGSAPHRRHPRRDDHRG